MDRFNEKKIRKEINKENDILEKIITRRKRGERKVLEIKYEVEAYDYRIRECQIRHEEKLRVIQEQIDKKSPQFRSMKQRTSKWDKLREGIVDLYFRTVDRSTQIVDFSDSKNLVNFQSNFTSNDFSLRKKLANQNPLLTLDMVSANLRCLVDFRKQFMSEMNDKINGKKEEASKELKNCKSKVEELEVQLENFLSRKNDALKERELALDSKKVTIEESTMTMRKLQKSNEKIMDEIKCCEDILNNLFFKLDQKEALLRIREIEMHKINKLKSLRLKTLHKHRYDQNKMKAEIFQMRDSYDSKFNHLKNLYGIVKEVKIKIQEKDEEIQELTSESSRELVIDKIKEEKLILSKLEKVEKERKHLLNMNIIYHSKIKKLSSDNIRRRKEMEKIEKLVKSMMMRRNTSKSSASSDRNSFRSRNLHRKIKNEENNINLVTIIKSPGSSLSDPKKKSKVFFRNFDKLYSPSALQLMRLRKESNKKKNEMDRVMDRFVYSRSSKKEKNRIGELDDFSFDQRDHSVYYKRKIKEKEKEISKIKLQIQKMIQDEKFERKKFDDIFRTSSSSPSSEEKSNLEKYYGSILKDHTHRNRIVRKKIFKVKVDLKKLQNIDLNN